MKSKNVRMFLYSAAVLLLSTAAAKFISAVGGAKILASPDPLFGIPFRVVLLGVATIETGVAAFCFLGRHRGTQCAVVAWLCTSFVVYRLGLVWVGYHKPCSCLGNITDALHIPPQTADFGVKIILAYLLIGSYGTLFWLWRLKRIVTSGTDAPAPSPPTIY